MQRTKRKLPPAGVMPLTEFSPEKQAEIAAAVAQDKAPEKWFDLVVAAVPSRAWLEWHWQRGIDPDSQREPLARDLRAAVIRRDGLVCQLCGGDVERRDVNIDHIFPYSLGGLDVLDNLQVTHSRCNKRKGARV